MTPVRELQRRRVLAELHRVDQLWAKARARWPRANMRPSAALRELDAVRNLLTRYLEK